MKPLLTLKFLSLLWISAQGGWSGNSIVQISSTIGKNENLTNCWVCHANPHEVPGWPIFYPASVNTFLYTLNQSNWSWDPPTEELLSTVNWTCFNLSSVICINLTERAQPFSKTHRDHIFKLSTLHDLKAIFRCRTQPIC